MEKNKIFIIFSVIFVLLIVIVAIAWLLTNTRITIPEREAGEDETELISVPEGEEPEREPEPEPATEPVTGEEQEELIVSPEPDEFLEKIDEDADFGETISLLGTSQKIINHLNTNFTLEARQGSTALKPEEFFQRKRGNAIDFMSFIANILRHHGQESSILKYKFYETGSNQEKERLITIFREKEVAEYIVFVGNSLKIFEAGRSFEDTCTKEEQRLGINITKYLVFPARTTDFSRPYEGYTWIEM